MSRRIRQALSSGAGAALVVALAACADAPTAATGPAPSDAPSRAAATAAAAAASQRPDAFVPGEILVGLNDDVDAPGLARTHGVGVGQPGFEARFRVMTVTRGNERAMAARLAADPRVAYAEPNYIRTIATVDPRLWAFHNPGGLNMSYHNDPNGNTGPISSANASVADADMDNVVGYAAGGADVVIGSIDTGVDFSHPEFTGRLIAGCDWDSMERTGDRSGVCTDFTPYDDQGHGTHTSGTMAGSMVGVAGVAGAAPHVKVHVQKVCDANGSCRTSAIVNAIYAAARSGVVAVNISIAGGSEESRAARAAIKYATTKGTLVIVATGNSGAGTIACNACDPNAIAVGATTWRDRRAPYSQYGPGLDISAPGGYCFGDATPEGCILSAVPANNQGFSWGPVVGPTSGRYEWAQGTSAAAPQVTGTAAVVASVTGLRGAALRARILSTADDLGAPGYDTEYGAGRVNTYRAVMGRTLPAGQ